MMGVVASHSPGSKNTPSRKPSANGWPSKRRKGNRHSTLRNNTVSIYGACYTLGQCSLPRPLQCSRKSPHADRVVLLPLRAPISWPRLQQTPPVPRLSQHPCPPRQENAQQKPPPHPAASPLHPRPPRFPHPSHVRGKKLWRRAALGPG